MHRTTRTHTGGRCEGSGDGEEGMELWEASVIIIILHRIGYIRVKTYAHYNNW